MFNRLFQLLALTALTVPSVFAGTRIAPDSNFSRGIPQELKGIGITEHLGSSINIHDLKFNDETGGSVALGDFFKSGRPVLLSLVYYECPNLCTFVLNGMVSALKDLAWVPGKEFEVVTISIDPKEDPKLAAIKKQSYLESLGKPEAAAGWHFLTGREDQIRKLADQIGFGYRYDEKQKQYAHGAAVFVLTPEGKISRYLYGISYGAKDLRLALLEASDGRIGSVIDRLVLFCYGYNPATRKYSMISTRLVQAGSAGTILIFGGYLTVFWTRQRRRESDPHAE